MLLLNNTRDSSLGQDNELKLYDKVEKFANVNNIKIPDELNLRKNRDQVNQGISDAKDTVEDLIDKIPDPLKPALPGLPKPPKLPRF